MSTNMNNEQQPTEADRALVTQIDAMAASTEEAAQLIAAHCAKRITELNQSVDMHAHALAALKDRAEKAEAQLHALRLVCGTTDANKFETACDRALARAEKAERELAEINNELSRNEIVVVRTENGYRVARGKIIARNQAKGTV